MATLLYVLKLKGVELWQETIVFGKIFDSKRKPSENERVK